MPHSILQLPTPFDPQRFSKVTARSPRGEWTVVLLDLYASLRRSEHGQSWVALAHVVEGELTQEVLIDITARGDGSTLVRLGRFGGPVITPGVKAAVGVLTDHLAALGAEVRHRGY